nr:tify [Pinus koraiensis]
MSRGQQLVTMDFLGIDQSKKSAQEIKYRTTGPNEKSIHWIKPQMMQEAFSARGLFKEYFKASTDSQDPKLKAASIITKELFPQSTAHGSNPAAEQNIATTLGNSSIGRSAHTAHPGELSTAQLTIFYNGIVNVYDVVEKQAEDIIRFVGNDISSQHLHSVCFDGLAPSKISTISSTSKNIQSEEPLPLNPAKNSTARQVVIQKLNTDLPLQRKQSLQRFLQNRKEYRMNQAAPYSQSHTQSLSKKVVN